MTRGAAIRQAALLASDEHNNTHLLSNSPEISTLATPERAFKKSSAKEQAPKKIKPEVKSVHEGVSRTASKPSDENRITENTSVPSDSSAYETALASNLKSKRKRSTTPAGNDEYMELPHNMGREQRTPAQISRKMKAVVRQPMSKTQIISELAVKNGKGEEDEEPIADVGESQRPLAQKKKTAGQHAGNEKGVQDAKNRLVALKVKLAKEADDVATVAADNRKRKPRKTHTASQQE